MSAVRVRRAKSLVIRLMLSRDRSTPLSTSKPSSDKATDTSSASFLGFTSGVTAW